MKAWKRIVLSVFVLLVATMSFGYWSLSQFNNALDDLVASPSVAILSIDSQETPIDESTFIDTDATSTDVTSTEEDVSTASSTDSQLILSEESTSATSTLATDQNDTNINFKLTFLPKKSGVYTGCTYDISWLASTTIRSLETTLVDAGTRKASGPVASGLAKENNIDASLQALKWKTGVVWPGEYFISISNVNGIAIDEKSRYFIINEMPSGLDELGRKNLCQETGGDFFN